MADSMHDAVRHRVAIDAIAAGLDGANAVIAWDACVRYVADHPMLAPLPGETQEQKRLRRAETRKHRAALRRVAASALGATLLTLLLNWALGRLVNWLVERLLVQTESTLPGDWESMFPNHRINQVAALPTQEPLAWGIRLSWCLYDTLITCLR